MSKPSKARTLDDRSALASAESLRVSPQKLNIVAALIRGKNVADALHLLTFSQRRIAGEVKKVLQSAIANAENNHALDVDRLVVREATIGKAFVMKRFHTRGRGKSTRILRPYAKIRIVVSERAPEEVKKAAPKSAEKKTETKTASKPAAKKTATKQTQE